MTFFGGSAGLVTDGMLLQNQGGERELVIGVDDELLSASPRSIPRADVAELCVQALLLPEAYNRCLALYSHWVYTVPSA